MYNGFQEPSVGLIHLIGAFPRLSLLVAGVGFLGLVLYHADGSSTRVRKDTPVAEVCQYIVDNDIERARVTYGPPPSNPEYIISGEQINQILDCVDTQRNQ